ncbi:MAG TPA: hypothetical protein VIJ07_11615 [Dermatophilaceae bacterium]
MSADGSYIPRYIDRGLDLLLAELPAVMLTGPRGCGWPPTWPVTPEPGSSRAPTGSAG